MKKKGDNKSMTGKVFIPNSVLQDRALSVLESIVEYLKEEKNMRFHEIALALKRDDRTIWTVYSRAKKKRAKTNKTIKTKNGKNNKK